MCPDLVQAHSLLHRVLRASSIPTPAPLPPQSCYKVAAGRTSPSHPPLPSPAIVVVALPPGGRHCALQAPRAQAHPEQPASPPGLAPTAAPHPAGFQGHSSLWIRDGSLSVCACTTRELDAAGSPCLRLPRPAEDPPFSLFPLPSASSWAPGLSRGFHWWNPSPPLSILHLLVRFSRSPPGVRPCCLQQRERGSRRPRP